MSAKIRETAKSRTLRLLEENRGIVLSGEWLASEIGVSRAAIWKSIESLRKEGYRITASTNKGYILDDKNDMISAQGMIPYLNFEKYPQLAENIVVFKRIESTNKTAKQKAFEGAEHGTVIVAEEQTHGRGRMGRDFFSPPASGLYMSIVIKPDFDSSKALLVTTAASVAVCRAIKAVCGIEAQIKWVNDIYVAGRKVCGILTEAITNFESAKIDYIILGIGVNCTTKQDGFPPELRGIAGSLEKEFSRNRLAAEIVNQTMDALEGFCGEQSDAYMDEYRRRSMVLRKEINVFRTLQDREHGDFIRARAIDISDDGGLFVIYENGQKDILRTGEISIRVV